jgi:hypothetical protein
VTRALLAFVLALGACAAPASYDGLAGGTKEDAAVTAPRPVSPVSVSLIASSRPRLRWDLGTTSGSKLTGAIVEMSRTRDFTKDVKRFEAKGGELVVPEDLELGVWFWRLKGNANGTIGTTASAIWEMVVRGPAAHGSSDAPTRTIADLNADGQPELLVAGTDDMSGFAGSSTLAPQGPSAQGPAAGAAAPAKTGPTLFVYGTDGARGLVQTDALSFGPSAYEGPISIGAGSDFDGDGATDVIVGGMTADYFDGSWSYAVEVLYGTVQGKTPFDGNRGAPPLYLPMTSTLPSVHEGADVDGDGYGDAVIGLPGVSFVMLGSAPSSSAYEGQQATIPLVPDPSYSNGASRIAMGGFDANGDGLADVAFSSAEQSPSNVRTLAAAGSRGQRLGQPKMLDGAEARAATAFAAGDFNGDGIDDLAITTAAKICIWFGDREKLLVKGPCVAPAAGETELGASLTAADIEGDGVDELLATSKTGDVAGVRVVRVGSDGAVTSAPIGLPGVGVRLTTIWPGRPGKARWAAVGTDGARVCVFEGADLHTTLQPPRGIVKGWGRGLR